MEPAACSPGSRHHSPQSPATPAARRVAGDVFHAGGAVEVRANDGLIVGDVGQVLLRNAAVDDDASFGELLREHFAVGGQVGEQAAVAAARLYVDVEVI